MNLTDIIPIRLSALEAPNAAKRPLFDSNSIPKSGWSSFSACPFESWMMPWALPILLPTISRKAVPSDHLVPLRPVPSRLAGYDDTNDAERLSQDPAMRVVAKPQRRQNQHHDRFETETPTRARLALMNPQSAHTPHRRACSPSSSAGRSRPFECSALQPVKADPETCIVPMAGRSLSRW